MTTRLEMMATRLQDDTVRAAVKLRKAMDEILDGGGSQGVKDLQLELVFSFCIYVYQLDEFGRLSVKAPPEAALVYKECEFVRELLQSVDTRQLGELCRFTTDVEVQEFIRAIHDREDLKIYQELDDGSFPMYKETIEKMLRITEDIHSPHSEDARTFKEQLEITRHYLTVIEKRHVQNNRKL